MVQFEVHNIIVKSIYPNKTPMCMGGCECVNMEEQQLRHGLCASEEGATYPGSIKQDAEKTLSIYSSFIP